MQAPEVAIDSPLMPRADTLGAPGAPVAGPMQVQTLQGPATQPSATETRAPSVGHHMPPKPDGLDDSGSPLPAWIARIKDRVIGGALIVLSLLMTLALVSWQANDPSMTYARDGVPENWLGYWGASFSDLAMQFFGFSAMALLVPPFVWGCMRLTTRPVGNAKARWASWGGALLLLATAMACIPAGQGWPLYVGLGGVVGDAILNIPAAFLGGYPEGFLTLLMAVLLIAPGLWLLARACELHQGLPAATTPAMEPSQPDDPFSGELVAVDEREDSVWSSLGATLIGLILHWFYSLQTALRLLLRGKGHQRSARQTAAFAQSGSFSGTHAWADDDQFAEVPHADYPTHPQSVLSQAMQTVDASEADLAHAAMDDPNAYAASASGYTTSLSAPNIAYGEALFPETHDAGAVTHAEPAGIAPDLPGEAAAPGRASPPVRTRAPALAPMSEFQLPALDLLSEAKNLVQDSSLSREALEENARILEGVLGDFGVKGQIIQVRPGPVVTLYELEPAPGIKSSRVIGLADDIARSMSAIAARVAVVPGRNAIGIELPNKKRETVYLREQLSSSEFANSKAKLPMCLGKTIGGEPVIADMAKMPHLLVAGTTGSGKSVAINTMILSLLYKHGPDKCKLIMIDPKMLELSIYDGIPHLLTPVVVDPKKAVVALKWSVREMEERYRKMSKLGVRNIEGYNTRIADAAKKGEAITRTVQTGFDRDTGEAIYETEELDLEPMPFIVVVIDEMADLMMVAGKDIEGTVQRLAQMARAAGIHVIMATQRPSTDVITGTIKANFPTRISFQVTSKIDSRVMLGESGAEQLLGMGDMLYMAGGGRITRVHGPFVDDQEVEDVVNHLKTQGVPQYLEAITEEDDEGDDSGGSAMGSGGAGNMSDSDDPYDRAVAIVLQDRKASTSYIQRRLSVGYNKAASLIERMEQEGLISPANHAGKREILVPAEDEVM